MSVQAQVAHRVGLRGALGHTLILARRSLLHIKSDPEQIVGMTIQPLMFLVLIVYVFGGAIAGSSKEYLQFALPGILIQGVAFTGFYTGLGLNKDFQQGLIDRFRSLPIARSSVISGRILADAVRVVWGVAIIVVFGLIIGFRFEAGPVSALAGCVVAAAFGVAMCWPMAFIGVIAKSPESVNTGGFIVILPLTFASSVFARPESMPGWLQAFVHVNPITHVVDATRGLMLGGPIYEPVLYATLWMIGITALFAPLTVLKYRRRV